MLTAINAAKFKTVRRTLLAIGTAGGALCFANPALASCVIAPGGTGTVANPGPNSRVVCTGTTTGINTATTDTHVTVHVEAGATLNGDPTSSAIQLDGSFGSVYIGDGAVTGPAILKDTDIRLTGYGSSLFVLSGSEVDLSGNPLFEINLSGAASYISFGPGTHVTVPRPIGISGGAGSTFYLHDTATLSASASFTGAAMINGGTGNQNFYLQGTVETAGTNPVETIVAAGDDDDYIFMNSSTRFTTIGSATLSPTFVLDGGAGFDQLYLANIDQSVNFDSTGIELLIADGGATGLSRIRGTHQFQEIRAVNGQLEVYGEAALGMPGSVINVLTDARVRFFGISTQVLTQQITGDGVFEYAAGNNEFASNNSITGEFVITGGTPLVTHNAAFGSAHVTNFSNVILRDVSIGNHLSGNGYYTIDGNLSTLTGVNNDMSGFVELRSGELTITDLRALGNGNTANLAALTLNQGTQFILDLPANGQLNLQSTGQVMANPLNGSGIFTKRGVGSVIISGSNAQFIGRVMLEGGWLHIADQDGLGTAAGGTNGIVFAGGGLSLGNITLNNQLSGFGVIDKSTSGRTVMTADNSLANLTWTVNAGTLAGTASVNFGQAGTNLYLSPNATFEITNTANEDLTLRFGTGNGTFRKLGAGRLNLVDLFNVSNFAIDAGSVRVNQVITANTNVASGASLDGTGRIIGTLTNNGTVAPGNSIGTLTVQGNYVHNSGSVLEIEFDANGNIDLLAVTGTASLNGGTLRFVSLGGAEGSGGTFLTATGGVTGTFASVQIMAPSVLTARPSTFNAQFLAIADNAFNFVDLLPGAADGGPSGKRLWIKGYGSDANRSASGTTLGYGHEGYGLAGGIVLPLSDSLTLGAAVGWSHGKIGLDSGGGSGEQSAVLGSVHLGYSGAGFGLEGGVVYGGVDQETLRNVSFNGFSASVDGGTRSAVYGGYLGARADLAKLGGWDLSARVRGGLVHQSQDGFTESGSSPLRLAVPDLASDTLQVQGGLGLSRKIGPGQLRFELGTRLTDNLGDRAIPVTFAASAAGVTLQGDTRGSVDGFASAALDLPLSSSVRLTVGYAGQVGQSDRHEGRIGLSIGF
jgi:uncharacterized protein with beta-barrel porin domain